MTHAHNTIMRNLNATLLQGPHLSDRSASYTSSPYDIKYLLFFVAAWLRMLAHHHHIEEIVTFPLLDGLPGVPPGYLDALVEQHKALTTGWSSCRCTARSILSSRKVTVGAK